MGRLSTPMAWLMAAAATGAAGLATLWAAGERVPPAWMPLALGLAFGSLLAALRMGQRALTEGPDVRRGYALPEARWQSPLEWALAVGLVTSLTWAADAWPLPVALLALPVIAAFPTFEHVVRPMLLATLGDLRPAPAAVQAWVSSIAPRPVRVDVYEGPLWNAFATGVLPFSRRVILGRPLLNGLSEEALRAVVAHELAHLRFAHPLLGYALSLACTAAFGSGLRWLYGLPAVERSLASGLLVVAVGSAVLGAVCFGLVPGWLMRRLELAADRYAARLAGPEAVARALRWLDGATGGRVSRGGLFHPSLAQRLAAVQEVAGERRAP